MENNEKDASISCGWCGRLMPPVKEFMNQVCTDCYRLLHSAGIGDEEIFAARKDS